MFDIYDDIPVGIDLGTTNSCIGYWDGKEVKIVPNRIGEKTTPSVVYCYKDEWIIGEEILKEIDKKDESEKIYSIKRIIGQDFNDKGLDEEIKNLHYNIIKNEKTNRPCIRLKINGEYKEFDPEYFSSLILQKLVKDAKKLVSQSITKVVISVPAYFDDAQRNATIEAAERIGLKVIRIINEPTAAALSYGLGQKFCPVQKKISCLSKIFRKNRQLRQNQNSIFNNNNIEEINNLNKKSSYCLFQENNNNDLKKDNINIKDSIARMQDEEEKNQKNIMVFDLGGGTFDLAILKLNLDKKEYEVKSKYSDKHLGGDDFDNKLAKYCLKTCNLGIPIDKIDKKAKERLKKACEYAKKFLSQRKEYESDNEDEDEDEDDESNNNKDIETKIRLDNFINEKDLIVSITKKQFEDEICKDLFDRLPTHFDELVKGAGLEKENIDEIILVGGSTRMPKIKKIIKKYFKCKINDEINPDEVVAYGATIQAAMLLTMGKNNLLKGVTLYDITPFSLGTDVVNTSKDPKIQALGNQMSFIIPKWTKIPNSKNKLYKTVRDNQKSIQICVFEGENDYIKYNKRLGQFDLINLPEKPKGEVQVKVIFDIDENNILTVTAFEQSKNISNQIKVESNRNKKKDNNISSNNDNFIKMTQDEKTIKDNEKKIQNLFQKYRKNINNNEKKKEILEDCIDLIREMIKAINHEEKPENINENIIEKYFSYVYQLLECLEEILYLYEYKENDEKGNNILNEIKNYINIFKMKSTYYIKQIIDLFKGAKREIFLDILLYSMQVLNESGKNYLNNRQKFSRYYAKLYFEEVINLYKKYKSYITLKPFKTKIEEIEKNCEQILQIINSNVIALIHNSKERRQLIEYPNQNVNNILPWNEERDESLFTLLDKMVNPDKNEDYNLILDELNRMLNEIISQHSKTEDEDLKIKLTEEKGICLGNIVKVKYDYQRGEDFEKYKKLIDDCIVCANICNKTTDDCIWYKEALELQKNLDEAINQNVPNDEEIKEEIQNKIEHLDTLFEGKDIQRFIDYILDEHPYEGYNAETREVQFSWERVDKELIDFLSKKYNPDNYPKNTKEEKKRYLIMQNICQKLNNLLNNYSYI